MSHCTCDYHQDQNKKSEWDVSDNGVQWTSDDFFKAKEKYMNKIEKLHHGMQTANIISSSSGLNEIIDAVNSLIDAHNEMVEEKEIIKSMVSCREKLAEVDKKYNNL